MFNKPQISQKIFDLATHWDFSGGLSITHQNETVYEGFFGHKEANQKVISKEDTYLIHATSTFLLALSILVLVKQKKLSIDDTLDRFIPEYDKGKNITIRHLLYNKSSIPCYFYEIMMVERQKDPKHQALSDEERFKKERLLYHSGVTFNDFFRMIKDCALYQEPGIKSEHSESNRMFLLEIIERVSNQTITEFQLEHIFKPLGTKNTKAGIQASTDSYEVMKDTIYIEMPKPKNLLYTLVTTADDMHLVLMGLVNQKILSKKEWNLGLSVNGEGDFILSRNINGIYYGDTDVLGYNTVFYFDPLSKTGILFLSNKAPKMALIDGEWWYLEKEVRSLIEQAVTYPSKHTRLVPYHKNNMWSAIQLKVDKDQERFVLDAKQSICMVAGYSSKKAYVLMESKRAVGLLVLDCDPKKNLFNVDILLVDKRYQHRGYGKIMLQKGLEILKKKGAKAIEIGVSRYNIPAQKLYRSLGFKEVAIYPEGMALKIEWKEEPTVLKEEL